MSRRLVTSDHSTARTVAGCPMDPIHLSIYPSLDTTKRPREHDTSSGRQRHQGHHSCGSLCQSLLHAALSSLLPVVTLKRLQETNKHTQETDKGRDDKRIGQSGRTLGRQVSTATRCPRTHEATSDDVLTTASIQIQHAYTTLAIPSPPDRHPLASPLGPLLPTHARNMLD